MNSNVVLAWGVLFQTEELKRMELRAVYVLVQLYAFFENGLYFNKLKCR